jgi:hypothetical protein
MGDCSHLINTPGSSARNLTIVSAQPDRHIRLARVAPCGERGTDGEGSNLLAFDQSLRWDIQRVQGAGIATGGLPASEGPTVPTHSHS